jgi:hypothetical protein
MCSRSRYIVRESSLAEVSGESSPKMACRRLVFRHRCTPVHYHELSRDGGTEIKFFKIAISAISKGGSCSGFYPSRRRRPFGGRFTMERSSFLMLLPETFRIWFPILSGSLLNLMVPRKLIHWRWRKLLARSTKPPSVSCKHQPTLIDSSDLQLRAMAWIISSVTARHPAKLIRVTDEYIGYGGIIRSHQVHHVRGIHQCSHVVSDFDPHVGVCSHSSCFLLIERITHTQSSNGQTLNFSIPQGWAGRQNDGTGENTQ